MKALIAANVSIDINHKTIYTLCMATKKATKTHKKQTQLHSRHARTREILVTLVFGVLILVLLMLTVINVSSGTQTFAGVGP